MTTWSKTSMIRYFTASFICIALTWPAFARADTVIDWNVTLNSAAQLTPSKHNPGTPTRAMAMMNAAIYDVFQAIHRTHAPFKVNTFAPLGTSREAAVSQAAYEVIKSAYPERKDDLLDDALAAHLNGIADGQAKTDGIALGNSIAQAYINAHAGDDLEDAPYPSPADPLPGQWSSDPLHPGQKGWGSTWRAVTPWAMPDPDHFDGVISGPPGLQTQAYADAFNQVKAYGELGSAVRNPHQTETGLFWAYDRPGTGAPPVLFVENLIDIADQAGNSEEENARMFAMATVAQADSCIAAWDAKFAADFWRPITAIRADAAHDDDNPNTAEQANWFYLGAPGGDPNTSADDPNSDDFTPPFPAYTSGHATMGGAIFKSVELFYGTNIFDEIDGIIGNNPTFTLHSSEFNAAGAVGMERSYYAAFTQPFDEWGLGKEGMENTPESENAMSRVYLGIHWMFDQVDGTKLGNAVAQYVAANYFQPVPEPSAVTLVLVGGAMMLVGRREPRQERRPHASL